ncbi:hypothetical protein [Micromonospora sp. NPDC048169]|uniref:hypothetical protein n=1 Tax=Micromonospora sp. NPDC048169 TaxID=3154711 RepID=UPI0033E69038
MNPEFERAQQDPAYLAWLDAMDSELRRFLTEDAPAVGELDEPYSAEGLALCEQAIRDRFQTFPAVDAPENADLADRFTRYIGEVHRRATEARWANAAHVVEGSGPQPQLIFPFSPWAFDPREQIRGAFIQNPQPPSELVWVLGNMTEDYERWVDFGRPTVEEFERLSLERLRAEADRND